MKNKILIAGTLMLCLIMLCSCYNDSDGQPLKPIDTTTTVQESNSLVGVWKLTAFVDVLENTRREPSYAYPDGSFPSGSHKDKMYTLSFDTLGNVKGFSSNNLILGTYSTDAITISLATEANELNADGFEYGESLFVIQSFKLYSQVLHLFYNDGKKYLEFNRFGGNLDDSIVTKPFYVFLNGEKQECGYLLFEDRGDPGLYHNSFVWTENLPKEYQVDLLPVVATYYVVKKANTTDCGYDIVNILNIQKQ